MRMISLQKKKALKKLKELTQNKMEESRDHGSKVREKRASRKRLPDFSVSNVIKKPKNINSNDVKKWFFDGIERNYSGKVTNPLSVMEWNTRGKQGVLANKLLELYGPELTEKTVGYFCDNWDIIMENSGGKVSGLPTIEMLWAMRFRIFADVELGKRMSVHKNKEIKKHMRGEFNPEHAKDAPGVGLL